VKKELGAITVLNVNINVSKCVLRSNPDFGQWLCYMYVCECVNSNVHAENVELEKKREVSLFVNCSIM